MESIKRILCPIDFSEFSRPAALTAAGLARDFGADVKLVHVIDTRSIYAQEAMLGPRFLPAARRRALGQLEQVAREAGAGKALLDVQDGVPHTVILQEAARWPADLVVMGTHGLSGFERLLLGSVTERVLHRLQAPLLTVCRHEGAGLMDPGRLRFRRILVALDLSTGSTELLQLAMELAARNQAEVLVLHVESPQPLEPGGAPAGAEAQALQDLRRRLHEAARQRLDQVVFAGTGPGHTPETILIEGAPSETILAVARDRRIDLVVLGVHGRGRTAMGWIGSTCHRVVRTAPCAVLAVRQAAGEKEAGT